MEDCNRERGSAVVRLLGKLIATGLTIAFVTGCGSDGAEPARAPGVNDATATPTAAAIPIETSASPVPSPTSTPELLRTFLHPSGLWQIRYLANAEVKGPEWDEDHTFEGTEFVVPFAGENFIALGVTRILGQEYPDSREWSQEILLKVENSSDSYELISWETVTVEGFQAYEAIYLRTGGTFDFAHLELHLIAGSDSYRIVGVSDQDAWDDVEELLRTLVHSFRPLE